MPDRKHLPFRQKTELFLLFGTNKVVAQDREKYIMFPGGGVEPNESIIKAGRREAREEAGAVLDGGLKHVVTVDFVWHPEWASNPKRKERYAKYQGERVHIMIGKCKSLGKQDDIEDAWKGARTMSISKCLKMLDEYGKRDHANTYAYRIAQHMALRNLQLGCRL